MLLILIWFGHIFSAGQFFFVCAQSSYRNNDMIFRILICLAAANPQIFGFEFHLRSLPCRQLVHKPVVLFLLLHRADETQPGRNSRTRLQFLALSLDSIMSEPRQAFYVVIGLIVIAL